jgi:transketolase
MIALTERGKQIRRDLYALSKANGGYHYGGSFSCVEILIALYDHVMKPEDAFILSKGHAAFALYTILRERGMNPKLEGHPVRDPANGIVCTSGSLGHGLPTAVGMALARRQQGHPGQVYVLMGDGEVQEGTTWESWFVALKQRLENLTIIIDANGLEGSGPTADVFASGRILEIAEAMGFEVLEAPGHDIDALRIALVAPVDGPRLVIAKTVKGAGVSFMEGQACWHSRWPNKDEEAALLQELQS